MQGKTIAISGGTSGLGRTGAEKLAAMGATIILIARDKEKAEATLARLRDINPHDRHRAYYADLSNIAAMKNLVADMTAAEIRLDVLINNAGAVFRKHELTEEGFEKTFVTNHLSYFVLTLGLMPLLLKSTNARIVLTASGAHRSGKLDFGDLQAMHGYRVFRAYGTSKLCNILFTRELARHLPASISVNCFHPGFVATNIGESEAKGVLKPLLHVIKSFAISPEKGADTLVYLASAPDIAGVTGGYFYRRRRVSPNAAGRDDGMAEKLWAVSEELTGMKLQTTEPARN